MPPIPGFGSSTTPPPADAPDAPDERDARIADLEAQLLEREGVRVPDGPDLPYAEDDEAPEPTDEELAAAELEQAASDLSPGQVVTHTYVDRYSGHGDAEVTEHAIVLAVDPDTHAATVAIFDRTSQIPADELGTV